ncbi:MAG: FAD-dependent oxidoreductase, partial [Aestuariivirga sp.]
FLPKKIEEGRIDDIRECIGCNICVTGDYTMSPIRCTQNPSMGEEWRRGWHPERIAPRHTASRVLVAGAGPAGLEAARALGQRGYDVTLADKASEAGGRVALECRLPGLAAWGRVRDWRLGQIAKMPNVTLYLESHVTPELVREFGADKVIVATGARWRRDGIGRVTTTALEIPAERQILTPDDLIAGIRPQDRRVLVYDEDHYYMGGIVAELLRREDFAVTLMTPSPVVSRFASASLEQSRIQANLLRMGVHIVTGRALTSVTSAGGTSGCIYTGDNLLFETDSLVLVTSRATNDDLYRELVYHGHEPERIGDCLSPGTIAAAVHAGRRCAEAYGQPEPDHFGLPYRRDVTLPEAARSRSKR